eukprot:5727720-Amphidinium_carterae.1
MEGRSLLGWCCGERATDVLTCPFKGVAVHDKVIELCTFKALLWQCSTEVFGSRSDSQQCRKPVNWKIFNTS